MLSDHPTPEAAGPLLDRFVDLRFDTAGLPTFTTRDAAGNDSGPLDLPAGRARAAVRFVGKRTVAGEGIDFAEVETRVADAAGRWWSATTFLATEAFCEPILPRGDAGEVEYPGLCYWHQAPASQQRALLTGSDVVGLEGLLDSRERYRLRVGDEWAVLILKYQGPRVDAVCLDGGQRVLVRLGQMVFEDWQEDPFEAAAGEEPRLRDIVDDVTLCYQMPSTDLLVLTSPGYHWTEWEQWYEGESLAERRPVFEPSREPGVAS